MTLARESFGQSCQSDSHSSSISLQILFFRASQTNPEWSRVGVDLDDPPSFTLTAWTMLQKRKQGTTTEATTTPKMGELECSCHRRAMPKVYLISSWYTFRRSTEDAKYSSDFPRTVGSSCVAERSWKFCKCCIAYKFIAQMEEMVRKWS